LAKSLAQFAQKFSLFAPVDVRAHEAEQALRRRGNRAAVTTHIGQRDTAEHTVLTDGQIVDVAAV
jgi:hypothetical protein